MIQIEVGFNLFDWVVAKLPDYIRRFLPQVLLERLRPVATEWQTKGEEYVSKLIAPIVAPLRPVLTVLGDLRGSTIGLFDKITKLTTTCKEEYEAIKNFKEDLHWKGRVVNAPQVVKKIKRLTEIPAEVVARIKDLIETIREEAGGKTPAELAEDAVDSLEGIAEFRGLLERLGPKLAKGAEKLLGVLAILVDVIIQWNRAIDDLQKIADDVREVRLDIEKLDLIFLPQNNARRWVTLDDGRRSRWRIGGHTHPS